MLRCAGTSARVRLRKRAHKHAHFLILTLILPVFHSFRTFLLPTAGVLLFSMLFICVPISASPCRVMSALSSLVETTVVSVRLYRLCILGRACCSTSS